jgi:hypothetical protein
MVSGIFPSGTFTGDTGTAITAHFSKVDVQIQPLFLRRERHMLHQPRRNQS